MSILLFQGDDLQDDISFVMKRRAEAGYGESTIVSFPKCWFLKDLSLTLLM